MLPYVPIKPDMRVDITSTKCEKPQFRDRIPNLTVTVGKDATLYCTVDNLGDYKVGWIHVDKQTILTIHTHVITHNKRFSVTHQGKRRWMLHIQDVQEEDRGYYMCQINTVPMISQVGYLDVVVPPEIIDDSTSSDMTVRENTNVTLTCQASGYPIPRIKWRRQDEEKIEINGKKVETVDGTSLKIRPVKRSHMGTYLCISSNGVPPSITRKIHLNVTFTPMIWIPNQLVGVPIGSDVTLECFTEAHPQSMNFWVRDDELMIVSSDKYEILMTETSFKVSMRLRIFNLQKQDYGSYRCKARNALGETEGSIKIYAIELSQMSSPGPVGARDWKTIGPDEMIYSESFSDNQKDNLYPSVEQPVRGKEKLIIETQSRNL
ncbi:Lachesin [Nymphon striatum]|nr:Lachesin [Nymphon striatum]